MKVILTAKVPTHHTMNTLRSIGLKHYKAHGSGVHESWEAFNSIKEAKGFLNSREMDSDASLLVRFETGLDRLDFIESKESRNIQWE